MSQQAVRSNSGIVAKLGYQEAVACRPHPTKPIRTGEFVILVSLSLVSSGVVLCQLSYDKVWINLGSYIKKAVGSNGSGQKRIDIGIRVPISSFDGTDGHGFVGLIHLINNTIAINFDLS